ncbi:hypothetical protein [Flagellimonas meridianipacifica]|uniref:Uncharacterized protein n=1 Tax=Flagellimonas meridianipacifica TaxID=1080225 RepID=A0A2T0MBV4_9FLAO|nr:hypothetical protein [Allomuricauda pacifica]PRX54971.1 hypothetical protein CLV81_3376 [Allomuricauda pacifica]
MKNTYLKNSVLIMIVMFLGSFNCPVEQHPISFIKSGDSIELNTDGLYCAEFFDYVFRGHFENIDMTREDNEFLSIFGQYLRAFGRRCPNALPADKVEIMENVCVKERVTTNGYGVETDRTCVQWKTVGTGIYARPELYGAYLTVLDIQNRDALRTTIEIMTDPNAMGNTVDIAHKAKGLATDMSLIFNLNACNSPSIGRLEENLRLFALDKPAVQMKERSKYEKMKNSGGPNGEQDFERLIDELVDDQAKTWAFNRYVPKSVSSVKKYTNTMGRPTELVANYRYNGFKTNSTGTVRIIFENGIPKCIYFFDFPNNCKTPNASMLASYAKGEYSK